MFILMSCFVVLDADQLYISSGMQLGQFEGEEGGSRNQHSHDGLTECCRGRSDQGEYVLAGDDILQVLPFVRHRIRKRSLRA